MNVKNRKSLIITTGIFGALTLIIMAVMNLYLMPSIESSTETLKCFDMNMFGYSYEQALKFVSLLSDESRNIYLHIQLPLDFVNPLIYSVFFISIFKLLDVKKKHLFALPILLSVFDYIENICAVIMLTTDFGKPTATIASLSTIIKSIFMTVCVVIALTVVIAAFVRRRRD